MKSNLLLLSILSFFCLGCQSDTAGQYTYRPPEQTGDRLEAGTLQEVGIDEELLTKAVDKIVGGQYPEVHAMLICKDGKLVLEEYFQGHEYKWDAPMHHGDWVTWDRDRLHQIHSDTKSITSACVGIAIDQGFIESVHQSIFDYFPEYQHLNTDGKDKITIEHLLTMTSGLDANEWTVPYSSPENPLIGLWFPPCEEPISCILGKPLKYKPGTHFTYFGGNQILLGEIIHHASGLKIDEFSKKYLFEPLGIDTANWNVRFPNGVIESAGCLQITPRAMMKFGVTYLNNGTWQGERIVPEKWVEKSAVTYANNKGISVPGEPSGRNGYSYSWWIKNEGKKTHFYSAGGFGGQHIFVFPKLNTVVVFTGGNYLTKRPPFKILNKYVIPAML